MAYIDRYALCKQITLESIIFKGLQVPESERLRTFWPCETRELSACRRFLGQFGTLDIFAVSKVDCSMEFACT